jgi:hypothetical protein
MDGSARREALTGSIEVHRNVRELRNGAASQAAVPRGGELAANRSASIGR